MQTISATHLARNTREVLDQVISQGEAAGIERNRTLIAQIMPPQQTMTAAQALAGLSQPVLMPAQVAPATLQRPVDNRPGHRKWLRSFNTQQQ